MAERIAVEVVHALRRRPVVVRLAVERGTTVSQALQLACARGDWPALPLDHRVGVFGKLVNGERVLSDGDRIEVLRPLVNDPKEIRRRRAAALAATDSARRR
jgi:putative ubiquitin-RnfH superfamily antitoxin RatB of RatAB toxin-antitoxin module